MKELKKEILTVDETATILGLARNSCYEGIKRGEIPHIKVGKRILVPRHALEKMLAEAGRRSEKVN
ncbi:hypothetical protein ES703_80801 [subsurface metagenome]